MYPIPHGVPEDFTVTYEDFVNVIIATMKGVGFGVSGGKSSKRTKKRRNIKKRHKIRKKSRTAKRQKTYKKKLM